MKILILALSLTSVSAIAQVSQFQQRSDEYARQFERKMIAQDNAESLAGGEQTCRELSARNNQTSCYFDPNARTSPSSIGEVSASGEWILGNGGVCVLGLSTGRVYCDGAIGLPAIRKARHIRQK